MFANHIRAHEDTLLWVALGTHCGRNHVDL